MSQGQGLPCLSFKGLSSRFIPHLGLRPSSFITAVPAMQALGIKCAPVNRFSLVKGNRAGHALLKLFSKVDRRL